MQCDSDGFGGVVAAEFEGAVDGHEHGLGGGALLGAIGVAVLPQDDRRTNAALREIVVEGHVGFVEEGEEVIPMSAQTFGPSQGVGVVVGHRAIRPLPLGQFGQTRVDQMNASRIAQRGEVRALAQTDAVADQPAELFGEGLPLGRFVVRVDLLQFAQQMHEAILPVGRLDGLVRRPEIMDERSGEGLAEEFPQGRTAPAAIDHVVTDRVVGEAPQPMRLPLDPPARLVGVQNGGFLRFFSDLFVPIGQDGGQSPPGVDQSAGREPGLQVIRENLDDLRNRDAQSVVKPTGQTDDVVSQGRPGHGVGHDGFDVFFAIGAIIAVEGVFGDHRGDLFGNVLDDPRATAGATLQSSAAIGTAFQSMLAVFVDALRCGASRPGMSLLGSRLFASCGRGRFGIHGNHARGRGRSDPGLPRPDRRLQFSDAPRHRQENQRDGLGAAGVELLRPGLVELAAQRRRDQRIQPFQRSRHPCHERDIYHPAGKGASLPRLTPGRIAKG